MKLKNSILFILLGAFLVSACDDNKMEWYKDPSRGEVTVAELPLELKEKISRYKGLKEYVSQPGFKLGIGLGLADFIDTESEIHRIAVENFNDITIGYEMKHGPMVNSKGEINFDRVDQLFEKTSAAGLSVYGHTLIWHQNQNATYLNSLIADQVIIIPDETDKMINVLENSDFESGTTIPWSVWGDNAPTKAISTQGSGYQSDYALLLTNPKDGETYHAQAGYDLPITLEVGKTYCLSLMVKADVANPKFQIQVQNNSNYSGEAYRDIATTPNTWIPFEVEFVCSKEGMNRLCLNFGQTGGVYLIDNIKFGEKKEDPDSGRGNLLTNGSFTEGIDSWSKWNGPDNALSYNSEEGNKEKGCMQIINQESDEGNQWKVQIHANLAQKIETGTTFYVSYYARTTEGTGSVRVSTSGKAHYQSDQLVTTEWTRIEWEVSAEGEIEGINFDMAQKAGTYLIDDVMVSLDPFNASTRKAGTRAVIVIPLTNEEKERIIGESMEDWISQMVAHCKPHVKAWDVVNEPMDDANPSELKTGVGKTDLKSDEFYWQDYLGKDYAVKAFQLARQHGNPDDILFINDYNLEYNLAKCEGLISYVQYIESKGVKVDGIGTQMHIAIDSNKDNIVAMLEKLAATGKLIKISELDIKVNTKTPTLDDFAKQAEMYQFVVDMYKKYIPAAQQYGITIWGVSDNPKEHENWIPDDAPNLWDANYERKHAYKGVADGLAGKDVSEDFSGELQ